MRVNSVRRDERAKSEEAHATYLIVSSAPVTKGQTNARFNHLFSILILNMEIFERLY